MDKKRLALRSQISVSFAERKENMDAYDKAVETALERGEDPKSYLDWKTTQQGIGYWALPQPDYSNVKIKVTCDCPPIPWRHFDYSAIDDNSFDADWDGE